MYTATDLSPVGKNTIPVYDFPIEMKELYTKDGLLSKRKAIVRTDTNKLIADVSNTYQLVEHKYIFDIANEYMKKFGKPEINFHQSREGAHIIGEYTFKDIGAEVQKNDIIGLKLFFQNSYRGDASVKLSVAGLRLACTNGMTAHNNEINLSFRHTKTHIQEGKFVNLDLPHPESVVSRFKLSAEEWGRLTKIEFTEDELRKLLTDASLEGIIAKSILDDTPELEENTAWGLYNQMTYWISHREKESAQMAGKISRLNRIDRWFGEKFPLPSKHHH